MPLTLEKPTISVVLPAYNEAENIESVIDKALLVLHDFAENYEIIIINDGSNDSTGKLLTQLSKSNPHIHPIHHSKNLGYGAALRSGFKNARYDYVFSTDSDGQFEFNELTQAYPQFIKADFIQGYRLSRQDSFHRKINTFAWNTLCNLLFHTGVKDVDCAFKFFKRKILDSIELKANGAMISTELLIKTRKSGFSITEIGVHHYPRLSGIPSGANSKVIIHAFEELFKFYRELHSKK